LVVTSASMVMLSTTLRQRRQAAQVAQRDVRHGALAQAAQGRLERLVVGEGFACSGASS
jgi:hypothetical protein